MIKTSFHRKTIIGLVGFGLVGCAADAQDGDQVELSEPETNVAEAAAPTINSTCSDDLYRQFDFWIGTWDVAGPNGQVAGVNRITSEEGGCLLVERWTGAQGGSGQSYNFVDRETGQWRQVWVSPAFTIDYSGGLTEDGVMELIGTIAYANPDAPPAPFRGRWTAREDGTVEQVFHQKNSETDEWAPWFTGIYTRRAN